LTGVQRTADHEPLASLLQRAPQTHLSATAATTWDFKEYYL